MFLKDDLKNPSQKIGIVSDRKEESIAFYRNIIEYEDCNLIYSL